MQGLDTNQAPDVQQVIKGRVCRGSCCPGSEAPEPRSVGMSGGPRGDAAAWDEQPFALWLLNAVDVGFAAAVAAVRGQRAAGAPRRPPRDAPGAAWALWGSARPSLADAGQRACPRVRRFGFLQDGMHACSLQAESLAGSSGSVKRWLC